MPITILLYGLRTQRKKVVILGLWALLKALAEVIAAFAVAQLVDGVFLQGMNGGEATPYLGTLLLLLLPRCGANYAIAHLATTLAQKTKTHARAQLLQAVLQKSPLHLWQSGQEPLALMNENVDGMEDFYQKLVPLAAEGITICPVGLLLVLYVDLWTALLYVLTFPIAPFLLYLIGQVTRRASEAQWQELSRLTAAFAELLAAIPGLRIYDRVQAQEKYLTQLSERFSSASMKVLRIAFLSAFFLELLTTLSIALIAVSIGLRLLHGQLDFACAFFVLLLTPLFYAPLRALGIAFHAGVGSITAARAIADFLSIANQNHPQHLGKIAMPPAIHFRQVSYQYPMHQQKVLDNISFTVAASSLTALAGESGAGKSTVLRLLLKFDAPTQGEITLNDLSLQAIETEALHARIAYIPQEPHVFTATLLENVTLIFDQKLSPKAIARARKALQDASLETLCTRGKGFDEVLTPSTLSFGEKRRLALARALYKNAPLWLLDEPTAGLDSENERLILQVLKKAKYRRTILMATHRPRALAMADTVLSLDILPDEKKEVATCTR